MGTPAPVVLSHDAELPNKSAKFVSRNNGLYTVQGKLQCQAPASLVYEILADYAGCGRVFSNILDSQVKKEADGSLNVIQTCKWSFGPFNGTFPASMSVQEDAASMQLMFKLRESTFMRDFEGRWQIQPAVMAKQGQESSASSGSSSSSSPHATVVTHQLSVQPMFDVPAPMGGMMQGIFVSQVEKIMDDLLQEITRRQQSPAAAAN